MSKRAHSESAVAAQARPALHIGPTRALVVLLLAALTLATEEGRDLVIGALADAWLQVSVFVAGTLIVFALLERALGLDAEALLDRRGRASVPIAALLGALPGCGGAIIVMTRYAAGGVGFGAVVAVLSSTMGDAAFLLLARDPSTAALVFGLALVVGTLSGWLVEALHGPDFLRQPPREARYEAASQLDAGGTRGVRALWLLLLLPGVMLGALSAMQRSASSLTGVAWHDDAATLLGAAGATLAVFMWGVWPSAQRLVWPGATREREVSGAPRTSLVARVVADTNFVTVWVVAAFVSYEVVVRVLGVDIAAAFDVIGPAVPAIAVLVGFIPGCGPQVIVTTLFLAGAVPLSAQLGNAISNDGDALFPAIAVAPRASLIATLYTAIPALLLGYGAWALGY